VSPGARALLKMPWLGTEAMTAAHWTDNEKILVTSYGSRSQSRFPFSSKSVPQGPDSQCPMDPVTHQPKYDCSGEADRLIWINSMTKQPNMKLRRHEHA